MRDYRRHPEPTSPDLGLHCLRAVMTDTRFDARVRRQAEQLLELSGSQTEPSASEASPLEH